jgi:uncharacterized surface protein with fasciclin (FAS1) repeats
VTRYSKSIVSAIAALGVFVAAGLSPSQASSHGSTSTKADIVDTAVSAGNLNTLVTAVKAAGLVETLKGTGPFTVFAPTDAAFSKIPKAKLDALLADKEALRAVLTYHVVPGKVMSADLVAERLTTVKTVQGESVNIDARISVYVNDATVTMADIETSNGVVHLIDTVIMPPSMVSALESETRIASLEVAF